VKTYSFSMLIFGVLIFILSCATSKPRMAVYVTGEMGPNEIKVLNAKILELFVNSEKYEAVERSGEFLGEIEKEQQKQRSGAVDDKQISRLGKQFGVQFVCVADITEAFNIKHISARLIDVETAAIVAVGNAESKLESSEEVKAVSTKIVSPMLKKTFVASKKAENNENTTNKAKDITEIKTENAAEIKTEVKTESKAESKIEESYQRNIPSYYNNSNNSHWYDDDDD